MKKIYSIMGLAVALAAAIGMTSCSDDNDDQQITVSDLPEQAQTFVSTYFPTEKISRVEKDADHSLGVYEVVFSNGYEVEFDAEGKWVDVDAPRNKEIPTGIAPVEIANYVVTYYPESGINELTRSLTGYEAELLNGEDLHFDLQGNFLYADR